MSLHHQHFSYKQPSSGAAQATVAASGVNQMATNHHFNSHMVPQSATNARQLSASSNQNMNINSQLSRDLLYPGSNGTMVINSNSGIVSNHNGKVVTKVQAYSIKYQTETLVDLYVSTDQMYDRGAFGVVYRARLPKENDRLVAIKQVHQDKRYRNRELPLMKQLSHRNIVTLLYYYYTMSTAPENQKLTYLNLVMEFMPQNLNNLIRTRKKEKRNALMGDIHSSIPTSAFITIKLCMYQIFRALAYIHSKGICHRDIKPNNLLFNPETGVLKVCDFGSAKYLVSGERNVSYICARYYRAPELLFGATDYTNMIDLWSTGVVFSELLLGYPIFHEESGIDQLVLIISKLGTPTKEQIRAMNKTYAKYDLPQVLCRPMQTLFPMNTPPDALDLISNLFQYDPDQRIRPLRACAHQFFDELREPGKKWLNGRELPPLFDFSEHELSIDPAINSRLMPFTYKHSNLSPALQQQQHQQVNNSSNFSYHSKTLPGRSSSSAPANSGVVGSKMQHHYPNTQPPSQQVYPVPTSTIQAANYPYNTIHHRQQPQQSIQYPSSMHQMMGQTVTAPNEMLNQSYQTMIDHSNGTNNVGGGGGVNIGVPPISLRKTEEGPN